MLYVVGAIWLARRIGGLNRRSRHGLELGLRQTEVRREAFGLLESPIQEDRKEEQRNCLLEYNRKTGLSANLRADVRLVPPVAGRWL